ncbi:transcriptional regulator [Bacteroides luti]|jgi:DNA-binding NarL/FixJ family response regulator|uniref:Transcriptional regulator n=1 Tax=Bacteroides luti TaxID=1297750 RepID=A0A1M4UEQ9_9BACE|nr:response regulator transcription factor [Bacteroides luti]SHE55164.1 transcriptional regulator [Bacteroides luti]
MRDYVIADNQDITKAGILFLLGGLKDVGNITEANNRAELIKELRTSPEAIVILDYTLFDFAGADELLILNERFPKISWILFSDELSEEFVKRVLYSSQSFSFVMKDNSKEEITSALQCAMRKERFICNHVSNMLIGKQTQAPIENILTNTEKIILKEIALGKTTKEIAAERNLSFHTINSHRKNIFRKLEVNNVHEATKYAMRAGIVDMAEYYI